MLAVRCVDQLIGPAVPQRLLGKIERGMSQKQIQDILGQPREIREKENVWEYSRFGNQGYVDIHFNDQGFVWEINDESIHRASHWHLR